MQLWQHVQSRKQQLFRNGMQLTMCSYATTLVSISRYSSNSTTAKESQKVFFEWYQKKRNMSTIIKYVYSNRFFTYHATEDIIVYIYICCNIMYFQCKSFTVFILFVCWILICYFNILAILYNITYNNIAFIYVSLPSDCNRLHTCLEHETINR